MTLSHRQALLPKTTRSGGSHGAFPTTTPIAGTSPHALKRRSASTVARSSVVYWRTKPGLLLAATIQFIWGTLHTAVSSIHVSLTETMMPTAMSWPLMQTPASGQTLTFQHSGGSLPTAVSNYRCRLWNMFNIHTRSPGKKIHHTSEFFFNKVLIEHSSFSFNPNSIIRRLLEFSCMSNGMNNNKHVEYDSSWIFLMWLFCYRAGQIIKRKESETYDVQRWLKKRINLLSCDF